MPGSPTPALANAPARFSSFRASRASALAWLATPAPSSFIASGAEVGFRPFGWLVPASLWGPSEPGPRWFPEGRSLGCALLLLPELLLLLFWQPRLA